LAAFCGKSWRQPGEPEKPARKRLHPLNGYR
jgi:hypothetical protein